MDLCESSGDYDYSGDDSDVIISELKNVLKIL